MTGSNKTFFRKPIRFKNFDYSLLGSYFITICTENRKPLFGDIVDGKTRLNKFGQIVHQCWEDLPKHYQQVMLDAFVIMPNHIHGIIILTNEVPEPGMAGLKPAATKKGHGLPEIVRAFKTYSARKINMERETSGVKLWQRSFFDRVIRNERELNSIRKYIMENPALWDLDQENPLSKSNNNFLKHAKEL